MAKLLGVTQGPKASTLLTLLCVFALILVTIWGSGCSGIVQGTSTQTPPPPPALTITISSLPQGTAQAAYSTALTASGGTAPFTWSISSGSLPAGLTLSNSGQISGMPTTPGTSSFVVKVTDSSSPMQSATANLSIVVASSGAPTITTQPTNQTVTAGQTAAFSVVASGTAPLGYQWQKNGANISGATSSSYTTPATTTSDSGSTFVVVVSNTAGTATSNAATLTVNPAPVAPTITTQPTNQTVTVGQTAAFSVVASGTAPLSYQWQKNGANISGATSSSYTTPVTTTSDSGSTFVVVVSNSAGTATSNAAVLTVNATAVAPTITTQPANQTVTAGQTATFTVVASGTAPLSYQWQKNGGNITGANLSGYTTPATTTSDSGSTFRVSITNVAGSVTSNAATLTVNAAGSGPDLTPPLCGLNNDSTNHPPTGSAVTTVTPLGGSPASYSWHDFVLHVPDVGGTWVDNTYGCKNTILTNMVTENAGKTQEYAITEAMDLSDCYIIAFDANGGLSTQYVLGAITQDCPSGSFGTVGQKILTSGQMPAFNSHSEFVWDYFTAAKFWNVSGNVLFSCTITGVGTKSCSNIHTFSEYAAGCVFPDYSTMDNSGNIDMICQSTSGGSMAVFTYNTQTNTKNTPYNTVCTGTVPGSNQPGCIHKLASIPGGGILIQFTGSTNLENGNQAWQSPYIALSPVELNSGGTGPGGQGGTDHVDCMKDLGGNAVCLFEDFLNNPGPWGTCTHPYRQTITFVPLSGNPGCVMDLPVALGWDISTRDYPVRAWELWSVQGSAQDIGPSENCNSSASYADPTTANWNTIENEIVLARVDSANDYSKIWRLGLTHERGKCGGNLFYSDPRASISFDGKYVVYATNARGGATGTGPTVLSDIVVMGPLF